MPQGLEQNLAKNGRRGRERAYDAADVPTDRAMSAPSDGANPVRTIPLGGVPLGRFRTKRGGHDADSAWQRHVGFATGPNPRRVLGRIQGCDRLAGSVPSAKALSAGAAPVQRATMTGMIQRLLSLGLRQRMGFNCE